VSTIATVASAIGTLSRKITRQVEIPISQPPRSGPTTVEIPLQAVQVPIAAPRPCPAKLVVITASDAGVNSAPAMPWTPRNTISVVASGAAAQAADATPKHATPSVNIRTSPKMSPSEPPTRMSDPSVSRYASTIHCWVARPPPRSRWIDGSATFTTVPSRNTIAEPRMLASRVKRAARGESATEAAAGACTKLDGRDP
jgi:hypothetical protein